MLSDSTFENITKALDETDEATLRQVAEEIVTRRPEIPPEVRDAEAFGPYRLGERLGRGGMGEVFKAWDVELGRWVALKLLRQASPALRLRFSRESIRLARLNHPSIVPVYRAAQREETPYIAMAWIEGRTLNRMELSVRESLEAVRTAARAIDFAHRRGIIHRDLKPQNIMMTESGHIYVVDFGLARDAAEVASTIDGSLLGTPAYMAPEQARGRPAEIAPHTDVYGLGATLYHLVTGRPPFRAEEVPALMLMIAGESPEPPRSARRNLHPDTEMIILTAMEKAPKDRYPTPGELADDIDRFLEGEPILARPMPWRRRAWRWMHRNPVFTTAMATALPLLVVMGVAWVYVQIELDKARISHGQSLHIREQRYAELQALRLYRKAIVATRGGSEGHLNTALIRIENAISWDPREREFYELKADILTSLRRTEEARKARDDALRLPP